MDFPLMLRVFPFFVEAAWVTVQISVLSLLLGLVVAAVVASAKMSGSFVFRAFGSFYVSVFRGTPCLIQLFVLYFGGPQIGINLDPFAAGVIGLGLNIGAYMAESIRGGILGVDRGQVEAARTIGFSKLQTLRLVVLPQAARLMIRPLGVNAVGLIKGSALVSTISVIGGLALVGGGTVLWLTSKPSPTKKVGSLSFSLTPSFGPQEAGVLAKTVW